MVLIGGRGGGKGSYAVILKQVCQIGGSVLGSCALEFGKHGLVPAPEVAFMLVVGDCGHVVASVAEFVQGGL